MESWHLKPKPPLSCGERLYVEEGPHVQILNLPDHRESIQNRSLGTFDTKGLLRIPWTYSGMALQQVTWQWHGSYTDAKCNAFNSSHRSETASFLFISQESSDLPQIGVFQNVIAGLLGSTEYPIQNGFPPASLTKRTVGFCCK